jgi:hypothetical protein
MHLLHTQATVGSNPTISTMPLYFSGLEDLASNEKVAGSNPARGSILRLTIPFL